MIKKKTAPRRKDFGVVYFIGIGGIGMSALARCFKAYGYTVAGSDAARGIVSDALRKEGIVVKIGHKKSNVPKDASFVVYNRAIVADNSELVAARELAIPCVPYAKVLGELTQQFLTIAITGSHGKSTTTALAGITLIAAGLDPTVLVGTNLREFDGKNIRLSRGGGNATRDDANWLVLEADDYGAAFLDYFPLVSIVTNIDREHMDFYKTFAGVKKSFLKFLARTREGGALILNRDDAPLYSLKSQIAAMAKKKKLHVVWYSMKVSPSAKRATAKIKKIISIPGVHNLSNAMAVYELGKLLKIDEKKILAAIGSYRGAWRRMEYRGDFKLGNPKIAKSTATVKIPVYDDYAHHPTEIKATLQAFREKFPKSSLVCVFQPHQAKRLKLLFHDFAGAFADADVLIIIPSYTVAGRDVADPRYSAEKLTETIKRKYPEKLIHYLAEPRTIKKFLQKNVFAASSKYYPACIIMMGAGDIVRHTDRLLW